MGCISSKLAAADLRQERKLLCGAGAGTGGVVFVSGAGDYSNHIVSLTSSTYGVLKLDRDDASEEGGNSEGGWCGRPPPLLVPGFPKRVAPLGEPEVINAWELMEDICDDDIIPMYSPLKKATAKPGARRKSFEGVMESPRKQKKGVAAGKENLHGAAVTERADVDPGRVLKPLPGLSKDQQRTTPVTAVRFMSTPVNLKIQASAGRDFLFSEPRKGSISPAPLFDPDLLASFEREHCEEEEQIKRMVSSAPRIRKTSRNAAASLLESFDKCCPPGGEEGVVLYTTTLRGIRRTFEDCNAVRAAVEAHGVQVTERDVSMDAGFREELRKVLAGKKGARVPVLFVRGRLVGGADEVLQLQDEGKLAALLAGIPVAAPWCDGCGGIRFVMCMDCSGSRKVFDEGEKKAVRCGECNENGLIHCPICC